jgi:hypothetical protein
MQVRLSVSIFLRFEETDLRDVFRAGRRRIGVDDEGEEVVMDGCDEVVDLGIEKDADAGGCGGHCVEMVVVGNDLADDMEGLNS